MTEKMNHICSSIFKKQKGFLSQSNQILIKGRPRIGEHSKYKYKKQSYYQQKCIFRLTNWQIIQNVGITFLGFQDIIKDVFLLAKLILSIVLSIGVASILSDPSTHTFATIVSFWYILYHYTTMSQMNNVFNIWKTYIASRSAKGQLILKANSTVFIWTKNWTKYFCISALAL